MGSIFHSPKTPDVPKAVKEDDPAVLAAAAAEAERIKRRRGYASTIKTGPSGMETEAPTLKKTLG